MNSNDPVVRLRPRFAKGAALVTLLLLPFLVHAAWGYIETRRLSAAIRSIEARGEPVRSELVAPVGDAATAARYYLAAAALASGFRTGPGGWYGELTSAERTGNWPDELLVKNRAAIAPYGEMLNLLDRAADLPFDDFGPGKTYGYLAQGLVQSSHVSSLRSVVNAFDGDATGATRSLYSALRAGRWFSRIGLSSMPFMMWFTPALKIALERVQPQDVELERLARGLAEADDDNMLRQHFVRLRAGMLSQGVNPWFFGSRMEFVVDRPWRTHQVNRQLAWYGEILNAVDAPWPERLDAIGRVDYFNLDRQVDRQRMVEMVESMVTSLAVVRTLRTAVAIERYRRGHSEQLPASLSDLNPSYLAAIPVDPFAGQPLSYVKLADGYIVYSAGVNRRNDAGDVSIQWAGGSDLGIAVRHAGR